MVQINSNQTHVTVVYIFQRHNSLLACLTIYINKAFDVTSNFSYKLHNHKVVCTPKKLRNVCKIRACHIMHCSYVLIVYVQITAMFFSVTREGVKTDIVGRGK